MKIYVNSLHQIVNIRFRPEWDKEETLKEYEVEDDFLRGYCDTLIKSFCYHPWTDDEGNEVISIYPYKDFGILESIQEQNDIRENQLVGTKKNDMDLDFRVTMLELTPVLGR